MTPTLQTKEEKPEGWKRCYAHMVIILAFVPMVAACIFDGLRGWASNAIQLPSYVASGWRYGVNRWKRLRRRYV